MHPNFQITKIGTSYIHRFEGYWIIGGQLHSQIGALIGKIRTSRQCKVTATILQALVGQERGSSSMLDLMYT